MPSRRYPPLSVFLAKCAPNQMTGLGLIGDFDRRDSALFPAWRVLGASQDAGDSKWPERIRKCPARRPGAKIRGHSSESETWRGIGSAYSSDVIDSLSLREVMVSPAALQPYDRWETAVLHTLSIINFFDTKPSVSKSECLIPSHKMLHHSVIIWLKNCYRAGAFCIPKTLNLDWMEAEWIL
jgi:hypothetical protein